MAWSPHLASRLPVLMRAKLHSPILVAVTIIVIIYGAHKVGIVSLSPELAYNKLRVPYAGVSPVWDISQLHEVAMHFEPSVHYQLNSTTADEQWAALVPDGGLVSISGENDEGSFMLSMFHQLRCLDILRRAYAHHEESGALESHCLNYIRQMVFCRRDLHLEPVIAADGPHTVQPWRTFRCLDWRQVYNAQNASDPDETAKHAA